MPGPWAITAAVAQDGLYIPTFVYRTGAFAPNGIPIADGFKDYFTLLNERDGGIEGVKIIHEECETNYDTKVGVECYERLKSKNPLMINPFSTGITYALIPKAPVDKIPILSMGYGRTDAAVGSVHAWVFLAPTSYWSQASAKIKYIAAKEGGLDKLKGKKLTLIYHNSPYGKEPIPTLEVLSKKYGYELELLAVDSSWPGAEGDVAQGSPVQPRLDLPVGLGRDEPGVRQGSGRHRLQDGPHGRRLVVGLRGRCDPRRRCRQGLHLRHVPRAGQELQGPRGRQEVRLRQQQGLDHAGKRWARCSTTARSSTP